MTTQPQQSDAGEHGHKHAERQDEEDERRQTAS